MFPTQSNPLSTMLSVVDAALGGDGFWECGDEIAGAGDLPVEVWYDADHDPDDPTAPGPWRVEPTRGEDSIHDLSPWEGSWTPAQVAAVLRGRAGAGGCPWDGVPQVTALRATTFGSTRRASFLLEGEPQEPEWRAAWEAMGSPRPYAEIGVWDDMERLGSFGGQVWPTAWPALFVAHRGTAQSGPWVEITAVGRELLRLALADL